MATSSPFLRYVGGKKGTTVPCSGMSQNLTSDTECEATSPPFLQHVAGKRGTTVTSRAYENVTSDVERAAISSTFSRDCTSSEKGVTTVQVPSSGASPNLNSGVELVATVHRLNGFAVYGREKEVLLYHPLVPGHFTFFTT